MIEAYENKIKSLEMEVQKIEENVQKAPNRMKEDGTARKRAEKKEAQVQNIGTGKKHGRQCSDFQTSALRKKKPSIIEED